MGAADEPALAACWAGRGRFVVLDLRFGSGHRFTAVLDAWRADPQRCARLHYVAIADPPPTVESLRNNGLQALASRWPPLTRNLHTLAFDGDRVQLRLAFGKPAHWLRELLVQADAIVLDSAPVEERTLFRALARLAAPGAMLFTAPAPATSPASFLSAGFEPDPGSPGRSRYAPRFRVRRPVAHAAAHDPALHEVGIIGAGLAGACAAAALARQGFRCSVFERAAAPACAASGNPGGLFHGVVHEGDGLHARAHRSAALEAARVLRPLIASGTLSGAVHGLLRLHRAHVGVETMRSTLQGLALPPEYVQALDALQATQRSGVALAQPAWYYPGGGWIDPGALVRHWLQTPKVVVRCGIEIAALRRTRDQWLLLDSLGVCVARCDLVVLAAAQQTVALLARSGLDVAWPLECVRGQVTCLAAGGRAVPRLPIAGAGFALTLPDGRVLCGATADADDLDPTLRDSDHARNLQRCAALCGWPKPQSAQGPLAIEGRVDGRVGWRLVAVDRLPLIGPVPLPQAPQLQARHVPREHGLFVCTAFGSRGITWAPIAGQVLASWVSGEPFPLEATLVDALDPARFRVRALRHGCMHPGSATP